MTNDLEKVLPGYGEVLVCTCLHKYVKKQSCVRFFSASNFLRRLHLSSPKKEVFING